MILMLVAGFEIELGTIQITHVAVFILSRVLLACQLDVEVLYIIFLTSSSLSICRLLIFKRCMKHTSLVITFVTAKYFGVLQAPSLNFVLI